MWTDLITCYSNLIEEHLMLQLKNSHLQNVFFNLVPIDMYKQD